MASKDKSNKINNHNNIHLNKKTNKVLKSKKNIEEKERKPRRTQSLPAVLFPFSYLSDYINSLDLLYSIEQQEQENLKNNENKNKGKQNKKAHKQNKSNNKNFIKTRIQLRTWSSSPEKKKKYLACNIPKVENFHAFKRLRFNNKVFMSNLQNSSAISKSSFVAYTGASIHEHNHLENPHVHSTTCERYVSGLDKNRESRFYFTQNKTPVRVYLSYNDKLIGSQTLEKDDLKNQPPPQAIVNLNGRKLSPRTLKTQLKISPQFVEEAKNYIFVKDTLSLVPPMVQTSIAGNYTFQAQLTYAEMAVMPFNNLPTNNQSVPQHHKSKAHMSNASSKKSKMISSATLSTSPT